MHLLQLKLEGCIHGFETLSTHTWKPIPLGYFQEHIFKIKYSFQFSNSSHNVLAQNMTSLGSVDTITTEMCNWEFKRLSDQVALRA